MKMKVAIAADHRGFQAKQKYVPLLRQMGHEILDFGTDTPTMCDYMDHAFPAARAVAEGKADVGVFFDGSGIGMSIAANKVRNVRAALAHDEVTARMSREKNHCNVLCVGSDLLSDSQIRKIIQAFLGTAYGEGRHARRVQKLCALEQQELANAVARGVVSAGA